MAAPSEPWESQSEHTGRPPLLTANTPASSGGVKAPEIKRGGEIYDKDTNECTYLNPSALILLDCNYTELL